MAIDAPFPVEYLKQILSYNAETGVFTWVASNRPGHNEKIAGNTATASGRNFPKIGIGYGGKWKNYSAAALAWFYVHEVWPTKKLRFSNGNVGDIRISNLVLAFRKDKYPPDPAKVPGWNHKAHLKARFGMTTESYAAMLVAQKGVCAICCQPETRMINGRSSNLAVDHDHATGKIRGLLCFKCNCAIGKFSDDTRIMARAIAYLRIHTGEDHGTITPLKLVASGDES